ncbi:hypothetical protein FB567DRAFT_595587 [Paraphoma chrysanthemicola]|uniref:Uncharacterized protein n=1 Tax=Paraphoma chrysanthemicola TaxID=798071 RepID=A0A8K0R1M6_9PLEO|nr:hypothetical protein FB567DRAFT_595587 [Paraphoma chrysanthemicola]
MSATGVQAPRITFADQNGVELTRRTQRRRGIYTPGDKSCMALGRQRSRSTPLSAIRIAEAQGVAVGALTSPENSFLQAPPGNVESQETGGHAVSGWKPRSSREWLTAGAAVFSSGNSTSPICTTPALPLPSNTPHIIDLDTADIEALEAGTAPPTPRELTASTKASYPKSKSWADLKLSRVEDTVNGWVGSLARWTDDTGGDEGVLLPMVRDDGRGFRKTGKVE